MQSLRSQPCALLRPKQIANVQLHRNIVAKSLAASSASAHLKKVQAEQNVPGMSKFLDTLKYDKDGLVAVIVQVCSCWSLGLHGGCLVPCTSHHAQCKLVYKRYSCLFAMQHIDTGEVMMQAYADRAAINETMQTGCVS